LLGGPLAGSNTGHSGCG